MGMIAAGALCASALADAHVADDKGALPKAPVKVVFDTDMFTDFDDVGALACLHALADAGECEILATVSSTRGNASVGAIEVINRFYGRPDIPTGAPKEIGVMGVRPGATTKVDPSCPLDKAGGKDGMHYKYRKLLADYPGWFRHADSDDAPDANEVYRRVLAAQPDGSVVVCSVGFLTNLRRLLETKPDGISPLGGRELVAKKVRLWVAMACRHPSGREFNSMCDAESSRIALEGWPTPVVFTDWNYGHDCFAGRAVAETEGGRNPVRDIFADNLPPRGEVERDPEAFLKRGFGVGGRSAWDETAVLIAVRGFEPYFNAERGTYRMVGADGSDEWIQDAEKGRHLRVTAKLPKSEVGRVIDELMTRKPLRGRAAPHRVDVRRGESLAAVRDRVRALPEDVRRRGVEVVLPPGDYVLVDSLLLDAKDGGASAESPVTWRGEKGARIIGGFRVAPSRFRPVEDPEVLRKLPEEARSKVVVADVSAEIPGELKAFPDQFSGNYPPPLVFANHAFATPARWPNEGFAKFSHKIDGGSFDPARRSLFYRGAFKFDDQRAARRNFASGVWLNGYWTHDWDNASVRAESWGDEGGTNCVMRLAGGVPYGVMSGTWGLKERRFYAFNLIEELDAPGEWWFDRSRKLLYLVPPSGELAESDEIFVSILNHPLVKGAGKLAHFAFENLAFEYSAGDGLHLEGSDVHVRNCRVSCCGGSGAIVLGDGNSVSGCEISQTGQYGVRACGGDRKSITLAGSSVDGNDIHAFGIVRRTYAPGVSVDGCGIMVRRNKIYDAPHSAVIYGGNEHLFESNEVHHVLLETGDAGAFYTGRDWTTQGTVLRYNFVHDLGSGTSYGSGSGDTAVSGENTMGFYFDDCDCGDAVYGNVFHNVARGIMIGGGREHPVVGNVFSHCNIGLSIDCRG